MSSTEVRATRAAFFVAGVAMALWAPLVPLAKARLGLDEAALGGLLLCLGLGSVLGMPFSGGLAARFGCRKTIVLAASVAGFAGPLLTIASTPLALGATLLLYGAGIGVLDVVMNIQAVIVEKASGRAMMSGFHGLFSVGGIVGAGGMTGFMARGEHPMVGVAVLVIACAMLLLGTFEGLLPYGSEVESPPFALPRGEVLLIGTLCFFLFLAEGSVLDWSGVVLREWRGMPEAWAGLGYVCFACLMTVGRLTGDRLVRRFGPRPVLVIGALVAATGFLLTALVSAWPVTLLGYAMVGAGAANSVPVLFTAAGRQAAMPSNLAISAVTTMGYAGILSGPAFLGFLGWAVDLPMAFLGVAVALIAVALSAKRLTL